MNSPAQGRVNADLEDRDEGPRGLLEGLCGQRNECPEEVLKALEALGNAVVIGRGEGWISAFAIGGEGHEDTERVFRAELVAFGARAAAVLSANHGQWPGFPDILQVAEGAGSRRFVRRAAAAVLRTIHGRRLTFPAAAAIPRACPTR